MCYVHSDRKHIAVGYIDKIRRKMMEVTLYVGEEQDKYWAEIYISKIAYNRRPGRGRYIAISPQGKVHLCCCRWTKADIAEADKRAEELWKMLQECKEMPQAE